MTDQAKFAEAVAELTRMLHPVLENPAAVAADIMRHLISEGWRPVARRVEFFGRVDPDQVVTKEQSEAYAAQIRKALADRRPAGEGDGDA